MSSTRRQEVLGRRALLLGMGTLTLAGLGGCGRVRDSRLNPFNWFGRSRTEDVPSLAPSEGYDQSRDRRPLVAQVSALQVDRVPGGALITATGLPPTQGFWKADLVPLAVSTSGRPVREGTTLVFEFRIAPPPSGTRQGPAQSRELTASTYLTDQDLAGVRTVTVRGVNNQRSARR